MKLYSICYMLKVGWKENLDVNSIRSEKDKENGVEKKKGGECTLIHNSIINLLTI